MPARAGAPVALDTPRTTSHLMPASAMRALLPRLRTNGSPLFEADHMTPGPRSRRDQGHPAGSACSSVSQGRDRPHRQTIANKGDDNYDLSSDFLASFRGVPPAASHPRSPAGVQIRTICTRLLRLRARQLYARNRQGSGHSRSELAMTLRYGSWLRSACEIRLMETTGRWCGPGRDGSESGS
jgi:hypothetical protein